MGRKFANILETVGNTPVVRIGRLAPPDVQLYVKIEAFNPLGSVKDRLALGVIEDAERTGKLKPGQTGRASGWELSQRRPPRREFRRLRGSAQGRPGCQGRLARGSR